jgi:prepilin-type processing-associated H-X9-DG protein
MRECANAFFLYAGDYRGYYPVARWHPGTGGLIAGTGVSNLYWSDFIAPYITRQRFNQSLLNNPGSFGEARKTVVWGCPSWDGINAELAPTFNIEGISVYENGFTMNIYPTYEPDYPQNATQNLPSDEWAAVLDAPYPRGQWYKQTQWTHASQRALVVESILWLLGFNVTDSSHLVAPQRADRGFGIDPRVGANHLDRYRHGRYPTPQSGVYPSDRGRVRYNVAFCDGHVESLASIEAGYRAIRMRDP